MIKLFAVVRRKSGMSPEEFHAHWRDVHAPLVAGSQSGSHVLRYERHPRPLDDYGRPGTCDVDGVTVQWFSSAEDYYASLREPDYADIAADVATFIDTEDLTWLITEEPDVVVDRLPKVT
jgi:uncharacterized protein (TIGR02118 family)